MKHSSGSWPDHDYEAATNYDSEDEAATIMEKRGYL